MPAPPNNQYWKFRKDFLGRKKEYTPKEWFEKIVEYFEWQQKQYWTKKESIKSGELAGTTMSVPITPPMNVGGLCLFADIDRRTYTNYKSGEGYEDFFPITNWAAEIIELNQLEGATIGAFNPNIIARQLGLADKQEIDVKGNLSDLKLPEFLDKK